MKQQALQQAQLPGGQIKAFAVETGVARGGIQAQRAKTQAVVGTLLAAPEQGADPGLELW